MRAALPRPMSWEIYFNAGEMRVSEYKGVNSLQNDRIVHIISDSSRSAKVIAEIQGKRNEGKGRETGVPRLEQMRNGLFQVLERIG